MLSTIPPIKYWFSPKRWKWFLISKIKLYLKSIGELNQPLEPYEQFNIAVRVVSAQECFFNKRCKNCKCDMAEAINTVTYKCESGCFNEGFTSQEQFENYLRIVDIDMGKITTKMKIHGE